jgi:hypothetical protein
MLSNRSRNNIQQQQQLLRRRQRRQVQPRPPNLFPLFFRFFCFFPRVMTCCTIRMRICRGDCATPCERCSEKPQSRSGVWFHFLFDEGKKSAQRPTKQEAVLPRIHLPEKKALPFFAFFGNFLKGCLAFDTVSRASFVGLWQQCGL